MSKQLLETTAAVEALRTFATCFTGLQSSDLGIQGTTKRLLVGLMRWCDQFDVVFNDVYLAACEAYAEESKDFREPANDDFQEPPVDVTVEQLIASVPGLTTAASLEHALPSRSTE
jgi:hypothetical protein